jgi:hypothetical protein
MKILNLITVIFALQITGLAFSQDDSNAKGRSISKSSTAAKMDTFVYLGCELNFSGGQRMFTTYEVNITASLVDGKPAIFDTVNITWNGSSGEKHSLNRYTGIILISGSGNSKNSLIADGRCVPHTSKQF